MILNGKPLRLFLKNLFAIYLLIFAITADGFSQIKDGIPDPPLTGKLMGPSLYAGSFDVRTFTPGLEQSYKIKNVITLSFKEETPIYLSSDFKAQVKLKIEYGHTPGSVNTINTHILEVEFKKNGGTNYAPKKYIHFEDAEYVKVTLLEAPSLVSGNIGSINLNDLLIIDNEMRATRFFELSSQVSDLTPLFFSFNSPTPNANVDELTVSWQWKNEARNTHTQLEWTFVEDELIMPFPLDFEQFFRSNATRIDLDHTTQSYNIPLLYGGKGKVYFRIRPVVIKEAGLRTDGPWSEVKVCAIEGHNESLNWQSSIQFAEDGKRKVVVQYFDGLLRNRQTVTKDNSSNQVIASETFFDSEGRPAIQILPTPGIGNVIAYTKNLNLFNTQAVNTDPTDFFDLEPRAIPGSGTPSLQTTSGSAKYYSPNNTLGDANIPDASGYPYSVTRYTPDGSGRIQTQSGVGPAFKMGSGHETKYYYGTPSQEQLYGLFGTEVGDKAHYFKNMVKDANGQMSVSYVDMHGRTIATALAGKEPPSLASLDKNIYPNQAGTYITQNLLDKNTNIAKNNSIESIQTILVPATEEFTFSYSLTPEKLLMKDCSEANICYECRYDLVITISDESGDVAPIVRKFNNIQLSTSDNCNDGTSNFALVAGTANVSPGLIQFTDTLAPGSYTIRKTLTVNEASLEKYKQLYLTSGKGFCKTEQQIIDSIYNVLQTITNCNQVPTGNDCVSCKENLGDSVLFMNNYLDSIGLTPATAPISLLKEISAYYKTLLQQCDQLCVGISQKLSGIRLQMLQDMIPGAGQYALQQAPNSPEGIQMFNTYNIFSTGLPNQPFYKYPFNPDGSPGGFYLDEYGNVDGSISMPITLDAPTFTIRFANPWTEALLPHHPEFKKLQYAESALKESYNWGDKFLSFQTIGEAEANQLDFSSLASYIDPFFVIASDKKQSFYNQITANYAQGLSMWSIAYGNIACKSIVGEPQRKACYYAAPKVPSSASISSMSQDQQRQVWSIFKSLYFNAREKAMNEHIDDMRPLATANQLAKDFILRFPKNVAQQSGPLQLADPNGVVWNSTTGTPQPPSNPTGSTSIYELRCASQIERWKQVLLQCPSIAALDEAVQINLLNQITEGMKQVCIKGSDAANPYGSSSVAPSWPNDGSPRSFEEVIQAAFIQYHIDISFLCNPYVIEFPKPYGKNPVLAQELVSAIDSCNCDRLATLKSEAAGAGKDPANLASFNQYLQDAYGDTLSLVLFNEMNQQCGKLGITACVDSTYEVRVSPGDSIPCDCRRVVIKVIHYNVCKKRICASTGGSFALSSVQPMPAFLKCGSTSPQKCVSCAALSSLTQEFKTKITSPDFNLGPFTGTDSLSEHQISSNILWAQFINYRTGYQYSWMDYLQKASQNNCNLTNYMQNEGQLQVVICKDQKPVNDPGDVVVERPCEPIRRMSIAWGQQIYQLRKEILLAAFEEAYRATCMAAMGKETFFYGTTVSEYHYTLYYYDQAGNLVKTVPPAGVRPDFSSGFIQQVRQAAAQNQVLRPAHLLTTDYRYNSLNQVVAQQTPDAGKSSFWYDYLGRLAVSQQAKQAPLSQYSYTRYDALGRIQEVGQKQQSMPMDAALSRQPQALKDWLETQGGARTEITQTVYDHAYGMDATPPINILAGYLDQQHLRGRVSYTLTKANSQDPGFYTGSFYSYDIHGNVHALVQHYGGMTDIPAAHSLKLMRYGYDLISGKVNEVQYQPGKPDAFYHRYHYDAENRLTGVQTSRDQVYWESDASYRYYAHGPLQRTVLGQQQVQGIDYAYTLQGWLKGVNSTSLQAGHDMGGDGHSTGGSVSPVARDVAGFALHYHHGDYQRIGAGTAPFAAAASGLSELFNGNISAMSVHIGSFQPLHYQYGYDQLNRIKSLRSFTGLNLQGNHWNQAQLSNDYSEEVVYDPNGNIATYKRVGNTGLMDDLKYRYYYTNTQGQQRTYTLGLMPNDIGQLSNRLAQVTDQVVAGQYTNDIDNQPQEDNYRYDPIGNLIADESEGISDIEWSVYGKITQITKNGNPITYGYDAAGNRILKKVGSGSITLYVRDASGNVMSVYERATATDLKQSEVHLYGSSRLGIAGGAPQIPELLTLAGDFAAAKVVEVKRGEKFFEWSNHLGNVLATVSDRKIAHTSNSSTIDYYEADIVSAQDYYPFGMIMPGRVFSNQNRYRYGINGQERSTELNENSYTADFWQYDSRVGRRWNIDPVVKDDESPYMVLGNNPIVMVDPNGADWYKNKKTGDIEYKGKWHGKHKGYESLGKGNGDWLHYEGKDYNKKTGDVITTLEAVTVTAKTKARNTLANRAFGWANFDKHEARNWQHNLNEYQSLRSQGVSAKEAGAKYEGLGGTYERFYQAEQDWRTMNYAILDLGTLFVPVPKVGMLRWFGSASGRVFWSGGGTAGKAFASATEHALLNGGTTLEMTTAGKTLTWLTEKTSYKMTGRLWNLASKQFAKGAAGDIHMFMDLSRVREGATWFKYELPTLESKGLNIITHIK
jgi:RHS repeat-associated protein